MGRGGDRYKIKDRNYWDLNRLGNPPNPNRVNSQSLYHSYENINHNAPLIPPPCLASVPNTTLLLNKYKWTNQNYISYREIGLATYMKCIYRVSTNTVHTLYFFLFLSLLSSCNQNFEYFPQALFMQLSDCGGAFLANTKNSSEFMLLTDKHQIE